MKSLAETARFTARFRLLSLLRMPICRTNNKAKTKLQIRIQMHSANRKKFDKALFSPDAADQIRRRIAANLNLSDPNNHYDN